MELNAAQVALHIVRSAFSRLSSILLLHIRRTDALRNASLLRVALGISLVSCIFLAVTAAAMTESHSPDDGAAVEERWIVLVDVSASLDQIDRRLTAEVGDPLYRLRNELLSLLQVLLGAINDVDSRRTGFLKVDFFGSGVESASTLPARPLHWEDARDEAWWRETVPRSLAGRTELMPALSAAAEDFAQMSPNVRKHLLIISDGELDVGSRNRSSGVPFSMEEHKAYVELMSPDNSVLEKLRLLRVQIDAVAIDPLADMDNSSREATIRKKLISTGEDTIQKQFLKLLEELDGEIASTGRQPYSEGPYFLHALAEMLGGHSRPVNQNNLAEVAWRTVFPDALKTNNVAPGSLSFVVLTKTDEPVHLCLNQNGVLHDLILRYSKETGAYVRDPADSAADVRVRYHATSRYVTWLIDAQDVTCIDPPAAYHGNNIELQWLPNEGTHAGEPFPVELELKRWSDRPPSLEWWRQHIAQRIDVEKMKATADVYLPDGSRRVDIPLKVESATDGEAIATLTGHLTGADAPGSYRVGVRLEDIERGWEETAKSRTFAVAPKSWIPTVVSALRPILTIGVLLCLSLLLIYQGRLRDSLLTPNAPFDFAVQNRGETVFTRPGERKAIRFVVRDDAVQVDIGRRSHGQGPTAVFTPTDRKSLSYRLSSRDHGWEYRLSQKGMSGDYAPLGDRGLEITLLDFVKRSTVDLRHGSHVVRIRHSSYVS